MFITIEQLQIKLQANKTFLGSQSKSSEDQNYGKEMNSFGIEIEVPAVA